MAATMLAPSSVGGLATCSKFCTQNEWNCYEKRKIQASKSLVFLSSFHWIHRNQFDWHMDVCLEKSRPLSLRAVYDDDQSVEDDDDKGGDEADGEFRKRLENIIGDDEDARFSGKDLAMLIRNKYGRSYDVQLIKKDFMGRKLLAMNVMWKYREQRSFPLTEEEYLLRLDDVANNLRCWGAVSYVRSSLAKTKERPRIGKAVSIFIDLDESGGRADEWIYR